MNELEAKLLRQANAIHDKIFPCASRKEFKYCFTRENDQLFFWYNTEDQSTHVIAADMRQYEEKMCS
jgi:hypothetical protein